MAPTREVTIKVTVETNVSAAQNGLKGMDDVAKSLRSTLEGITKQFGSMNSSASMSGADQIESLRRDAADAGAAIRRGRSVGIRGSVGSSQRHWVPSAAEIEAEKRAHRAEMRSQGYVHQVGFQKLKQDVSDNDVANAVKKTSREKKEHADAIKQTAQANEQYRNSSISAAHGAMEFAKGLALVGAAQDKDDASLVRHIATIQGYYNLVKGGHQALSGVMPRGGSSSGTGASTAASGAATAASAGGTGAAGALTNPYALLAAAALAAALALRQMNIMARERVERQKRFATEYAEIHADAANQAGGRYVAHMGRLAGMTPNRQAEMAGVQNQYGRAATEAKIREAQAESPLDYEGREQIRSRMEQSQAIEEKIASAKGRMEQANRRKEGLAGAGVELSRKHEEAKAARERVIASLQAQKKDVSGDLKPTDMSPTEQGMRSMPFAGAIFGAAFQTAGLNQKGSVARHVFFGDQTTNSKRADNLEVDAKIAEKQEENKAAEKSAQEEVNQLNKDDLETQRQQVQTSVEYVQSLRERANLSRQIYEQNKEANATTARRIGGMHKGEQLRLKRIIDKVHRGDTLTKHESQTLLAEGHGTKAYDKHLKAVEAEGRAFLGDEFNRDEAKAERKKNKDESELAAQGPTLKKADQQSRENAKAAEGLVEGVKEAFDLSEFAARLKEIGQAQRAAMEEAIVELKAWFQ